MCISSKVFTCEQEDALVKYAKRCIEHYHGLSRTELRRLAFEFAKRLNISYPPSWNENSLAGWTWYYKFMARHTQLVLRTPEQTSLNRVKAFCKKNVDLFFQNLSDVLKLGFDEYHIYNMDETGFSTVPSKIGQVIAIRGMRRVGQIASQEKKGEGKSND